MKTSSFHGAAAAPRRGPHGRGLAPAARRQRGVVLVFGMIALVILLIGAAALMRSLDTAMFNATNFGFKRDLTNQGERALNTVVTLVRDGALSTIAARQASDAGRNYSATMLATNAQGIPNALLTDAGFVGVGVAGNDIVLNDQGVTLRYVIDRLCLNAGAAVQDTCTLVALDSQGANSSVPIPVDPEAQVVYRISVRVDGPRRTQSYFQATLTI